MSIKANPLSTSGGGTSPPQQPAPDQSNATVVTSTLGGSEPKQIEVVTTEPKSPEPKQKFALPKFSLPDINLSPEAKKNLKILAIIVGALAAIAIIGVGVQYGVHGGWSHALGKTNGGLIHAYDWLIQGSPFPHYTWFAIGGSFLLGGLVFKFGPKAGAAIYGALKDLKQMIKDRGTRHDPRLVTTKLSETENYVENQQLTQKKEEQQIVQGGGSVGNLMPNQGTTIGAPNPNTYKPFDASTPDASDLFDKSEDVSSSQNPLASTKGKNNDDVTIASSTDSD